MAREKQSDRIEAMEAQMASIMGMLTKLTGGAVTTETTTVAKPATTPPVKTIPAVQPVTIQANGNGFTLTAQNQFSFRRSQNGNPLSGSHGWEKVVDPTTGKQYKVNIMIMEA